MFIVIEGADGSGKATQFNLTVARLRAVGHEVVTFDFPQYDQPSSIFVSNYLQGKYGPATEVSPYTASLFYALDRFHASAKIKSALEGGKIVVANRYVGSNMAHQGSKFTTLAEQRGFFLWEDSLEYEMLSIPRPDMNIYLRVPLDVSKDLISKRSVLTNRPKDGHESNLSHLGKTIETYDLLTKLFPKDFIEINCAPDAKLLSVIEINDLIWETIKPLLPQPKCEPKATVVKIESGGQKKVSPNQPKNAQEPLSVKSILDSKAEHIEAKEFIGRPLKLASASPRNELELLSSKFNPELLDTWNFRKKQSMLLQELPNLLSQANYEFETDKPGKLLNFTAEHLLHAKHSDRTLYDFTIDKIAEAHPRVAGFIKSQPQTTKAAKRSNRAKKT